MDDATLYADCTRCIGLCCVLLAFDRGPMFAFDKPAGEPCVHLKPDESCAVHHRLEAEGCAGCARYDCLGASQAVTAMFAGRSWRDGAATVREMYDAFVRVRERNRMRLASLRAAGGMDAGDQRAQPRSITGA